MHRHSNTKVPDQDFIIFIQQHIFWLNVTVNESSIVCILQAGSDLFHIGEHFSRCQPCAFGMELTQRAIRSVLQDQERNISLYTAIEHLHDMRMVETC